MTVFERIDEFVKKKKAYNKLSEYTSMSDKGLRTSVERGTLTLKVYMLICDYFKLDYMYFIDNKYDKGSEINFINEEELKYNSITESDYQEKVIEKLTKIVELLEKK